MRQIRFTIQLVILLFAMSQSDVRATDRYYLDLSEQSPAGKYIVEAKSPDNANKEGRHAFQASFVYTCRDTTTQEVLWTKAQPMFEPQKIGEDADGIYVRPAEGSPVGLFVSDAGWTVIYTGRDELVIVDLTGQIRGRIGILGEGFTAEENAKFVRETSAGPMWEGYSLWYFLNVGEQSFFVVRPWWGRRVVLNLETGKVAEETPDVADQAFEYERNYVLTELTKAVQTRKKWDTKNGSGATYPIMKAAYLAGRLPVPEAGALLDQLQDSRYGGGSGRFFVGKRQFDGEVDPGSFHTLTVRQVIQLSLRRLGKTPRQLPANRFDMQFDDYEKNRPYVPKRLRAPRETYIDEVQAGQTAEQVLDLIGAPDFVGRSRTWEYDMDASPPFSLILKWDERKVVDVQRVEPALWKEGFTRDEQIVR